MTEKTQKTARSIVLGHRVAEARKRLKLSQVDLAFKLDVTQGAVAGWERNEYLPALETIVPLAQHLEVTVDWLIFGDGLSLEDSSKRFKSLSGISLVSKLSNALEAGELSANQIALLATLMDEFTRQKHHDKQKTTSHT